MNVERLHLKNFKRFTDLEIDLSSGAPAKLVLLIGANGSGKSSVFDAFEYLSRPAKRTSIRDEYRDYVDKDGAADVSVSCSFGGGFVVRRSAHGSVVTTPANCSTKAVFYGRSSLRTVPVLLPGREARFDVAEDADRPERSIDADTRFETDIAQITAKILQEVWGERFDSEILKTRFVDPINDALARVFSNGDSTNLRLTRMVPTLQGKPPDIRFQKGESDIHYDLLSSGEKEVFNILINLFNRREHFANAIYFIDELDVHLHTRLQYALIKEVVENWIPENSQLWTASHSLGFLDYGNTSSDAVLIDFDDLDFDHRHVLKPARKTERIFDIAVPRSSALEVFPNKRLILCENEDARLYNAIGLPDVLFVSERDKNAISIMTRQTDQFHGLIDRDFLGTREIDDVRRRQPNLYVLSYYCIENYLYHPDNVAEVAPSGFDEARYRTVLHSTMQTIRDRLLVNLEKNRNSYEIIKTISGALKSQAVEEIAEATAADDFETFYRFLSMKSHRPGDYLAGFNLRRDDLAATNWMRSAICAAVAPIADLAEAVMG